MLLFKKIRPVTIFFTIIISYFTFFWFNVLRYNANGDLLVQQSNMWADWALHFTLGSTFAEQSLWHAQNPLLFDTTLSYPPVADWLSAGLIRLQVPFFTAFIIPSLIFSILFVVALYVFTNLVTTKKTAIVSTILFLFNGGLGFWYFIVDVSREFSWSTIAHLPQEYTNVPAKGIHFMSFITSMVYPQRSLTIGFPLILGALSIILYILILQNQVSKKIRLLLLTLAGIILGFSSLLHPHSAFASAVILVIWFLIVVIQHRQKIIRTKKVPSQIVELLTAGIGALVIAIPIIHSFYGETISSSNFISFNPGFMAGETQYSWLTYWIINWGVVPILALIGFYILWKNKPKKALLLLPFLLLFIMANIWQFQPWIWDNMKLLIWSAVGISVLAAVALRQLWNQKSIFLRLLAIFLFSLSIFSGLLDQIRSLQFKHHGYVIYINEELALAEWVRNNTSTSGTWLTGTHHNNWAYNLTGRQTMIAYPGWLTSHGLDEQYMDLHHDHAIMLNHPNNKLGLFEKYNIQYVSIGPNEINKGAANINEFNQKFTIIKQTENYTILKKNN